MFEKVNPKHPDKIADRIAGAIVDYAYTLNKNPKVAVEVLIGHNECNIIIETSEKLKKSQITKIARRIAATSKLKIRIKIVPQDIHLATNQKYQMRCGDNGIFRGMPISVEQAKLAATAKDIYSKFPTDGKYILDKNQLTICQSQADTELLEIYYPEAHINPLGYWEGGINTDAGATNRKLGSDMGDAVTGGGLHGKDLTKADVSVNIYAHLEAQKLQCPVEFSCAIGDTIINNKPYEEIVEIAREYIESLGGFEKFAEWGLI